MSIRKETGLPTTLSITLGSARVMGFIESGHLQSLSSLQSWPVVGHDLEGQPLYTEMQRACHFSRGTLGRTWLEPGGPVAFVFTLEAFSRWVRPLVGTIHSCCQPQNCNQGLGLQIHLLSKAGLLCLLFTGIKILKAVFTGSQTGRGVAEQAVGHGPKEEEERGGRWSHQAGPVRVGCGRSQ
uniref:Uncharacterized protein n=1 Tax=Pipistrellus kuhlii TaxID=59472 RepID=A0A7J8A8G6_PIPKU|nr:hypothetical protein mPipKuh1_008911 [Pipistrellus kuhlii]